MKNDQPRRLLRGLATCCIALLVACGGGSAVPKVTLPPAVGKRVVYIADSTNTPFVFEAYATSVGTTTPTAVQIGNAAITGISNVSIAVPIASPTGKYLGVLHGQFGACTHTFSGTNTTTQSVISWNLGSNSCIYGMKFNATGTEMSVKLELDAWTGPSLGIMTGPDASTIYTADFPASGIGTGSVAEWENAGNGSTVVWTQTGGMYSSILIGSASGSNFRSADEPSEFAVTNDGSRAVYVAPGETRFRATVTTPLAAQSSTYLTAALAPGDTLGAWALSPDGATLLYEAHISGSWQLWIVSLAAPLGEQRVDGATPVPGSKLDLTLAGFSSGFAFNSDGTRFAFIGDAGGSDLRVYAATVAAPTVATALTPAADNPYVHLGWSGTGVVIYGHATTPGTTAKSLRSVAVAAPLTTATLSPTIVDSDVPGVNRFEVCGDGTIVFEVADESIGSTGTPPRFSQLFSVQPMLPGTRNALSPALGSFATPIHGISSFACEQ